MESYCVSATCPGRVTSWRVAPGDKVRSSTVLLEYQLLSNDGQLSVIKEGVLKSTVVGIIENTMFSIGETIPPGAHVVSIEKKCDHSVVVHDLCTDCGINLRTDGGERRVRAAGPTSDRISMVHGNPGIQISRQEAEVLANKDTLRLLSSRKLALIIDLDQTLIHTSIDPKIEPGLPDVYGFRLPGHNVLYHCRLRPHARQFLKTVSQYYETHVFTMGTKQYAASVTHILDPDKKLFYGRTISRDECFDPHSKALRLKSVFPCGDEMVAIIDDREDVWGNCPNLIHVKPYVFFAGTSDINAPPGSAQHQVKPGEHPTPVEPVGNKDEKQSKPEEPESSSSSSEDSSSSTSSSDIDDTVFDELENSPQGGQNKESNNQTEIHVTQQSQATSVEHSISLESEKRHSSENKMEIEENSGQDQHSSGSTGSVSKSTETQPTNSEKTRKIQDPDNFLLYLADILQRAHKEFYSQHDKLKSSAAPDLKQIIPEMRQSVLKGTRILFTGVVPTNMPPQKSREWNTARAFGATIHDQFVYGLSSAKPHKAMRATTHVIAGRPGTSKLREAKRISGIKIVNPRWLWSCAEQWKLVDERDFPVDFEDKEAISKKPPVKIPKISGKESKPVKNRSTIADQQVLPLDKAPPRVPERHMSIESYLSVSDGELEKMNAEVDAEVSSTSSEDNSPELGTLIESRVGQDTLSYEEFIGSRKRGHDEVSSSSDNSLGAMDESVDISERSGSDSGDELAALLGNT